MFIFSAADVAGSPPGEYAQEVPTRKPGEKPSGPPILPPHLLQVILNKDTPAHVSIATHLESVRVEYMIVSIPDLCTLIYFNSFN